MVASFIAKADLATEMTVVRNEMEAGENNPGRVLMQRTLSAMYPWHNYGKSTIGARADVENVDIARLQAFYRLHYQPDNATLIVAGKFDPAQALEWVGSRSAHPAADAGAARHLHPRCGAGWRAHRVAAAGRGSPMVFMGFPVMPAAHPTSPRCRCSPPSWRTPRPAGCTSAWWKGAWQPGCSRLPGDWPSRGRFCGRAAGSRPGRRQGARRDGSRDRGAGGDPISADELERARTQWLNDWKLGHRPTAGGCGAVRVGGAGRLAAVPERNHVPGVDAGRCAARGRQWLKRDNRTVAVYLPTDKPTGRRPERVDVAAQLKSFKPDAAVAQAEAFDPTPANIDAAPSSSSWRPDARGAVAQGTRGQVAVATLTLRLGDRAQPAQQATVAALAGSLIDKGGAGLTRQQIADRFDQWQAQVGIGIQGQSLVAHITTTRAHRPR